MKRLFPFFLPLFILSFMGQRRTTEIIYDGPYVKYCKDQIYVCYVHDSEGLKKVISDSFLIEKKNDIILNVPTDEAGKTFQVKLKQSPLQNEKNETGKVSKQFVVSDMEANFKAFRLLLQANQIIDSSFEWTFGDGHLVLTGDFFDRGFQQTELLWLIYSLEEKAKAAGGYVHYILGNHEIMNLSNDLRYVHPKYMQVAALMGTSYLSFYDENSELGRWLRTKNVAETVGDVLYVHGGISQLLNEMDLSIPKINKAVRPHYADSTGKYPDMRTEVLYSDLGPFWYRGYYAGAQKATQRQVDSTLSQYRVKYIATGHTVIADTISLLYNGKVFNTDIHHTKQVPQGLLIENGKFYRATVSGERFPIGN